MERNWRYRPEQRHQVVVLRRAVEGEITPESGKGKRARRRQASLQFANRLEPARVWKYSVLVTNADYQPRRHWSTLWDSADCGLTN